MAAELSPAAKRAWVAFFVSHALLVRKIDREMQEKGAVPVDVYDVLLVLEDAPDRRLRMSELADRVLLSRSGITRLVDRLEKDGLVERQTCPSDRRACHAALTEKGLRAREEAWPFYREAIARHFGANMSDEEAERIADVLGRMVEGCPHTPESCGNP